MSDFKSPFDRTDEYESRIDAARQEKGLLDDTETKYDSNGVVTELGFHGRFVSSIFGGTKRISLRIGARKIAKNIKVRGFWAVCEGQYVCKLKQVPFTVFENEGWYTVE
jgi:hypothetical protein